ncbi:serine/threonine-protein kinase [Rhodopirellula sp. SWK7]|uniref:serine/threonine-protein kinase n=1 Tax=Rhodopirellula sp. SWK7 TaxID=595460 RepID=UPI0002BF5629|nr:serine/threonine-protein kinase [Rhodopirellula sp. SWK7]EMI45372.1 serine/threonine-protein kinase [Rhodopirellula sp. SWK7]
MSEFEYLGPYEIGKIIGRGGMGSVYEATHAKSGERVAVKLIAQHVADDMRFRRRFDAEIETLRRLRHPGIVRLIGYGEEKGRLFYAMELVHGESLQQRIRDVKRMGWLPAVDIAIQITSALKHAHDIGVIHRDLKPANLLLTEDNQVKLVDFGIAKLFGYGEQTLAGSVLGTADYMAPEQAGDGPITPRTDLYALGSVMYAMMAGRSPFAGKKLTQVIESLKRDRAVPLELINPEIPLEVVEIVHHLLEKDPKQRPPTALAVSKRLKATRAGLQRGQTVALENDLTRSGTDVREGARDPSDTQHSHETDASHVRNPGTHQQSSDDDALTTSKPVSSHALASDAGTNANSGIATAATATPDGSPSNSEETENRSTEFVTSSPVVSTTTFKTIASEESEAGYFGPEPTVSPTHHWIQFASIAAMIAILAGGVYLFVMAVQTPSADSIFSTLQTAEQDGDLTLNTTLMERFLTSYPDDENADQVRQWQRQAELEQTLKRLSARARRFGGVSQLDPAAQAFLDAMQLRETSSEEAQTHLHAWLDVFASDDAQPSSLELVRMTRLVRDEVDRLESTEPQDLKADTRVAVLMQRLTASKKMTPAERTNLLRGIIRLYQNDAWARPVVDQATEMLAAENGSPTS